MPGCPQISTNKNRPNQLVETFSFAASVAVPRFDSLFKEGCGGLSVLITASANVNFSFFASDFAAIGKESPFGFSLQRGERYRERYIILHPYILPAWQYNDIIHVGVGLEIISLVA